jgi:ribosome-binding protein aMBF1 (putative translation factor)
MMCSRCGSYAINPHHHGRDQADLDLCDVCYWRKRAERRTQRLTDKEKSGLADLYNSTSISIAELIEAAENTLIEKNKGE